MPLWERRAFLALSLLLMPAFALGAEARLSSQDDYRQYIDPLLKVEEFGIHYYDDGAADATVLHPHTEINPWDKPRQSVINLVRLGAKSLPLLIDCLNDPRQASIQFDGNNITRQMNVPV